MHTSLFQRALYVLIIGAFSFTVSSCEKDDVKKPRAELLIGNWLLSSDAYSPAYDVDGNGTTETEVFPLYSSCSKDDIIAFNAGGGGAFDQGALTCNGNPEQRSPFTWSLYNNDHSLVLAGESYALLELTQSVMKIAYTFQENNITYTNTYTFNRK